MFVWCIILVNLHPECPTSQVSWCKCEAVVDSLTHITVATEQAPPPPLVVMSLSMKITVNPRTGTNEVSTGGRMQSHVVLNYGCLAMVTREKH